MKYRNIAYLFLLMLIFSACQDKTFETFMANAPVYLSYEELRKPIEKTAVRDLINPGKIYFKDNYVFVNELMEGVHIFDVSDPSSPKNEGFIAIPGNVDISIKGNLLYADSYVDLVVVDLSNMNSISEKARIKDVFPFQVPEFDNKYPMAEVDKDRGVVTAWDVKLVKQERNAIYYPIYYRGVFDKALGGAEANYTGGAISGSGIGVGGSMARFGLYKDLLYITDESNLYKFNIADANNPIDLGTQYIGWGVETMFVHDDYMFLGTRNGMLIFSLEVANNPTLLSQFNHITSCDPVVIQNHIAYVTLRGGTICGSNTNRLDVVRLSDNYMNPALIASYPLNGPYGLGIDDEVLFVCDGDAGLKVYNAGDPYSIDKHLLAHFPEINTYDVIPLDDFLFMIGKDGFYLYDYSDLQNIHPIGTIPIVKKE